MCFPTTQYTKCGNINIAYQVFGSGSVDLVYIPGWVSNIDLMWSCPELVDFFKELGKIARVILFDKRGTGLSDRNIELSTLEDRMEDINAVMNAVGSEKAILFGHSEGGSVSALFSAIYPHKVISLITFGIFAKRKHAIDYPWAPTDEERQEVYEMIENDWCNENMQLETLAPSKANDEEFMSWLARYFRSGASPSAALKLTKMNTDVNIIDILKFINIPTLVMQRRDDVDVKIEEGKFVSERIKNSKFVEFEGSDHLFWVGNTKEILDEIRSFVKTNSNKPKPRKRLFTVLFGQVANVSKRNIFPEKLRDDIEKHESSIIYLDEKCFAVTFKTPGKALDCGLEILTIFRDLMLPVKMGVFMKEGIQRTGDFLNESDKNFIDNILSAISVNTLCTTQTIKNLLSGADLNFTPNLSVLDNTAVKACRVYSVEKNTEEESHASNVIEVEYDTFLEDVLRIIYQNIDNNDFGVEMLSKLMNISERQLFRKIKETTNKSPIKLINHTRLQKAKEELLSLDMNSISEIAFKFGFSSPSYFSKCFKKEFGYKPTVLQQKLNRLI